MYFLCQTLGRQLTTQSSRSWLLTGRPSRLGGGGNGQEGEVSRQQLQGR